MTKKVCVDKKFFIVYNKLKDMETTIFYISASIFFLVAAIFLCITGFYLIKILMNFQKASLDLREVSHNLREKASKFSSVFAGISLLLEKITKAYFRKKKRSGGSKK